MAKKNKQKLEGDSSDTECLSIEHELDQLAEALCVKQKHKKAPEEDPFNNYMEDVEAKFHSDPHHFKSRLAKGYQVLLQQLQADGSSNPNQS